MGETEHDDLGNPTDATELAPSEPIAHDPEPTMPEHLRLEAGHMSELMGHIKAWFAWATRQV